MSYTKRAVRAFILVFVINIIAAFLGYLIRIVLARNLTVAEYGLFFSVFTLISLLSVFIGFGMIESLVKYIPEFLVRKKHDKIKNSIAITLIASLGSVAVLAIILILSSDFLAKNYFKVAFAKQVMIFFIIIMLFSNLRWIVRSIFQAFQRMTAYSIMYLTENILILALLLYFFAIKKNLYSVFYSHILAYVVILIVFSFVLFRVFNFFNHKLSLKKELAVTLLSFGLPVMLSGIGGTIIIYVDTLILTYFRSIEEVGIYNVVVPTVMLFQFFASSIATVIFPMVSELWVKNKKQYLASGLKILYQYAFVILVPMTLIALSFSKAILHIMFGESYIAGAVAMQILLIAIMFLGLYSITSIILSGIGKPAIGTKILLEGALINFIINLFIIPLLGMVGAAIASLITYAYVAIRCMLKIREFIEVQIPWKAWLRTFIAGMLMLGLIVILSKLLVSSIYLTAAICIVSGGLFYLALIFIFKIININEIKDLAKHISLRK